MRLEGHGVNLDFLDKDPNELIPLDVKQEEI
jgi:hypothetical protein